MAPATITTATGHTWQEIAQDRQAHRDASIAALSPPLPALPSQLPLNVTDVPRTLLTKDEFDITECLVEQLVSRLASGTLSAVHVTNAFLRRAGLAQGLVSLGFYFVMLFWVREGARLVFFSFCFC